MRSPVMDEVTLRALAMTFTPRGFLKDEFIHYGRTHSHAVTLTPGGFVKNPPGVSVTVNEFARNGYIPVEFSEKVPRV